MSRFVPVKPFRARWQLGDRKRPVAHMLSHLRLLRQLQCIVNVYPQVAHSTLQFGMAQ